MTVLNNDIIRLHNLENKMTAGKHDFDMDQGSFFSMSLTISENSSTKDLSTYAARAKMRSVANSSETQDFTVDITQRANGIIVLEMPHATSAALTPGFYLYDVEIFIGNTGSESYVERIIEGRINLRAEVTK
nr:hypothetical protein [uncultured Mediterranean phage uvMED]